MGFGGDSVVNFNGPIYVRDRADIETLGDDSAFVFGKTTRGRGFA
jgi:hypothetical protein